MGKIIETKINRWDGGMTHLKRGINLAYARIVKQFDILSDSTKMQPNPDMANDTFAAGHTAADAKLCKFLAAKNVDNSATILYALGIDSNGFPWVFSRSSILFEWDNVVSGAADDLRLENLFIEYQGRIYFGVKGTKKGIQSYGISGQTYDSGMAGTLSVTLADLSNVYQGIVHSKDDILYIPYTTISGIETSAFIASKNGSGAFNATALTLPKNMIPIKISEYGNYVAIAMRPVNIQSRKSVVYLWDRDSSLATLSESIDWGFEKLETIEEIDGVIVGVSSIANTSSEVITHRPQLVFKYWIQGSRAKQFLSLPLTSAGINNDYTGGWDTMKINNRILFTASVEMQETRLDAIWAIARKDDGSITVSIDRLLNNGTAITTCAPRGFYKFGDYYVVGYTSGTLASPVYVAKITINGAATYTATSSFETIIMGESFLKFKLTCAGVMFEKLPADGQVVLKYRIDGATSWTTIFTETTDDLLFREAINCADGTNLPEFREIEFQIISMGGAVITGFWAQAEEVDKGLVSRILKIISGWIG